jgi:hypothetical protein
MKINVRWRAHKRFTSGRLFSKARHLFPLVIVRLVHGELVQGAPVGIG